ncbi:MAG: glutamate 5-kinase [Oscillospiraceae bacterium]|jgi:glutamate 5-kinase|nr:glutamate 5-kinase [Oscillospiraceae bacterium]
MNSASKKIVIKIGTSSLTYGTGMLNYRHIEEMADVVCDLKNMGHKIVIVSSGAVGIGLGKINNRKKIEEQCEKPAESSKKRALAAAGQSGLMAVYEELFNVYNCQVAQALLTKSSLENADNRDVIAGAFEEMFAYDVLPIVNENDVAAGDDASSGDLFGDNDTLSAYVAKFIKADMLIIWSDIDGLYDKDPRINANAKLIPVVTEINGDIHKAAGGVGSPRGSGGMATKLRAAKTVMDAGIDMVITNSANPENLYGIINGEKTGTLFKAVKR